MSATATTTTTDQSTTFSSLVSCYFNSEKKLVAELGYGYDIFSGTYHDAFGRRIIIEDSNTLPKCKFLITKQLNQFLVQVENCLTNVQKVEYSITHDRNALLPMYSSLSSPMMVIPFTTNYINSQRPQVNFNLVARTLKDSTTQNLFSGYSFETDGVFRYENSFGPCIGHECYLQMFVNESRTLIDNNFVATNTLQSTTFNNYQMFKLDQSLVTLPLDPNSFLYSASTSGHYSFTTNIFFRYVKDCYYLAGGDKTHHHLEDLTLSVQSTDLERCPLYSLTFRFENEETNSNSKTFPANGLVNGEKTFYVQVTEKNQGWVTDFISIVNTGIYPLLMRQVYISSYQTTGQVITLQSIINSASVTNSQIFCKLIAEKIEYDYTPNSIRVENFKTYSKISVSITVGNPGVPYRIRVTFKGDNDHYNDFLINPQSKPNSFGICKVSTVEENPIAYDTIFGIYCENYANLEFRSLKIQVLNDEAQSILTLSNTKQTRIFARLPKSALGKSNTVLFTLTDANGAIFEFKDTYTASIWSDLHVISGVDHYIRQKQVRNYQTANNFAILLDILADYCKRNTLTSSELVTVKEIIRYAVNETFNIRDIVFHPTVYPESTELLFALFRESANLAYSLGFTDFNEKFNQLLNFMIKYGRKSSFSNTNDYSFLVNLMTRFERNQNITDTPNLSNVKSTINGLTSIASLNSQFNNDFFTYQSFTFYSSDEIITNEINLENSWVRVHFGSQVANLVKSQSEFRVETSLYKKYIKDNNITIPLIASINLKRLDKTLVNVTGLQTPVTIYFNMDLINSTLSSQYRTYQSRLSCYYLNEVTNNWANDGLTSETSYENGQLVVKCSSTHLTSFTIFSDLFNGTDSNSNLRIGGLSTGEKVAIGVTISLFLLILLIVIVIIIIVIVYCQVKRGKNSKSIEDTNPITKSSEMNAVSASDSGPSLFISDYKSMREPAVSANQSLTSVSSASTSSPMLTSTNGNVIIGKKYEILEKIGQGAFGAVFRAKNLAYSGRVGEYQVVAIKKIQLSGLSEMNDKFKEAVNMFKIRHDCLVCLEDAVVDESTMSLYLVMKFYSEGDLDKFIKSKQHLPECILKQIIEQVCEGLQYLEEERNMLHRDIKPSNIFISNYDGDENNIKTVLSDFGLAKENNMMSSVSFAGTPYYMSPQALIGAKYSFNADIFSLGCTIFILITHDNSQSIAQLYFQHQGNFSEVHSFITSSIQKQSAVSYSHDFIQLLLHMLEFDPNKRPNASGVLKLLKNLPTLIDSSEHTLL